MRCFRFSPTTDNWQLTTPLLCLALLPAGLLAQQTPSPAKPPAAAVPPPAAKADTEGTKTLEQAITQLDPSKLGWLEAKLWQEMYAQGLRFTVEGNYLSGPGHRLRLDLKIGVGSSGNELLVVSDGKTVWDSLSLGKKEKLVTKWDLKTVEQALDAPGTLPQVAESFYSSRSFFGIWPLLRNLNKQMKITKHENVRWHDRDAYKLTGTWIPEIAKQLTIQDKGWQPSMPRLCYLFLDKQNLWPLRLELWGPLMLGGPDFQLLQMEFRDPHITKKGVKPPDRYEQALTFTPPQGVTVRDMTKQVTDQIAMQLRVQPKPAPSPK
jgi:hypothetical protein